MTEKAAPTPGKEKKKLQTDQESVVSFQGEKKGKPPRLRETEDKKKKKERKPQKLDEKMVLLY